jgi:acetolactate synthase-1/2/3 large subunit
MNTPNGGSILGEGLARHGVQFLFTLCGGHISPILVGAKAQGIQVIDVRDEASAVFAADAVARMTGVPGVAAVTAGPGVTNTLTAVKNAQMAQSPVILFGGAAATVLKGRGSLQDIDQLSMLRPITKWATTVKTVSALGPTLDKAVEIATTGVPGPVFIEVPVDLLYDEAVVREWYLTESGVKGATTLAAKALGLYLRGHLYRQFHAPHVELPNIPVPEITLPGRSPEARVNEVMALLRTAKKPALVVGSQTLVNLTDAGPIADAIRTLGIPVWLGGAARGLLGRKSDIQFRHKRSKALKEADVVVVCGFPFDFRLGYGRSISGRAQVVSVNLDAQALKMNRRPEVPVQMHPGQFLKALATANGAVDVPAEWFETLRGREAARDDEITAMAQLETPPNLINTVAFFQRLEEKMSDDAALVVDGGDFVATGAYTLRPRAPLSWLDPGVFGTLGVGGGFATGAAAVNRDREVWIIWGDGSSAYSLAEFDTWVRHGLAPIAVIGTDASWAQIAREQTEMLGDDVGTVLLRSDYHLVAEGYGGKGLLLTDPAKIDEVLDEAKALAAAGTPVCINVHIAKSDFRKGSLSM